MITPPDYKRLKAAIDQGFLIIYPTDTLYALGASVFSPIAVEKAFTLKKRPISLPIPIAVSSKEMLEEIAIITPLAACLIESFLPGPLTIVIKNKMIPSVVTANKTTIAVRIPDDSIALNLIKKIGPLTVTSANIHNQQTPTTIEEIRSMFKSPSIYAYIDDGIRNGLPSTIVDVTEDKPLILRKGTISSEKIEVVVSENYG